jgi:ABC-type glycerol-3-phosphate transport system permease component
MEESTPETEKELSEQDARWHVIYASVIVFAVLVITTLYFFSRHFSS